MTETLCIRCGKARILAKKWKEKSERGQTVFFEQSVCPDAECQKIVDAKFDEMRERREGLAKK